MSAPSETAAYEAIVGLAERELELAADGRYHELAQLAHQREQLMARLPSPPPRAARDALTRALLIQRRVTIELLRRREQVVLAARRLELQRRAARGYAGTLGPRGHRIRAHG
jgi:hypothetical protein